VVQEGFEELKNITGYSAPENKILIETD